MHYLCWKSFWRYRYSQEKNIEHQSNFFTSTGIWKVNRKISILHISAWNLYFKRRVNSMDKKMKLSEKKDHKSFHIYDVTLLREKRKKTIPKLVFLYLCLSLSFAAQTCMVIFSSFFMLVLHKSDIFRATHQKKPNPIFILKYSNMKNSVRKLDDLLSHRTNQEPNLFWIF